MSTRERVHHLVDKLPEDDLEVIERYLDRLQDVAMDPAQRAFLRAATLTPENLSPEDEAAIDDALGEDEELSHDEVRRMLLLDQ
jgi:hypothetical protein